jgi:hypothetical protein
MRAAVNRARRHAWAQAGGLPPVRIADRVLEGVTCIRLDATVVPEPKTLRYRLLHAAARLVRGGRRRTLKIAAAWPWTDEIVTAWQRIQAIPHPL